MFYNYDNYCKVFGSLTMNVGQFYWFQIMDKWFLVYIEGKEFKSYERDFYDNNCETLVVYLNLIDHEELFITSKHKKGFKNIPVRLFDIQAFERQ